jgi:hypothetical protein
LPLVLLAAYWAGYFFSAAHILHALPAVVLLAGYGLSYLGERLTILKQLPYQISSPAIVYAALMIIGSFWIARSHWDRELVDWRGTAAFLQETVQPGDTIAMPQIYPLLEYYAPQLGNFRTAEFTAEAGSMQTGRRVVVCYDRMSPDPCSGFRSEAVEDEAWSQQKLSAFTVFIRSRD